MASDVAHDVAALAVVEFSAGIAAEEFVESPRMVAEPLPPLEREGGDEFGGHESLVRLEVVDAELVGPVRVDVPGEDDGVV